MSQEIKVTFINNHEWKLPFNFAVGLHIAVIAGAIYIPQFFDKSPPFPDIYTVDLINIESPSPQKNEAQPAPAKAEIPPPESEPVKENSAAIIETPPKPAEKPIEPVKPVSIKPLKRKLIKKVVDNTAAVEQKKKLDEINKQNLEEVRRAEQLAEEAARLAAMEAVNQLKDMLRESNTAAVANDAPPRTAARSSSSNTGNVLEKQYYSSVFSRLQPHWQLPEYKRWDQDLSATIVVRIARDGSIIDQYFEKKSGDRIFDQFVLKALQDGSPLPPIPAAMKTNNLELGLRFIPGSIE